MEDFYIMKKRNKIVAFLLAGVIAAGHGSVVYAAGYGSVVYEDVAWDLCALNEERMKLEVQEKNTDNDAAGNDQADIEERESPQSTSEYADIGIASVLNYVNLRTEPSVESEALGKLYNNSAATVLETVLDEAGEEWYLVSSGSVENAYVKAEYVKVGDEDLARGVGQVVIAADNVRDAHVGVVADHGEVVGGRAVGAHDDHVVEHLDHALFAVAGDLGVTVEGVLVDGDLGELHVPGATHLIGVDDKRLSHCSTLP